MQLHKTMRIAGVSLSAAALALLTAEGPAAAHERMSSPDLRGRVTSVASGDFVLQKYDGTTETVDTTDATTYSEPGSSIAPPGVYDGENVAVTLDPTASSPTATNVVVFPEKVGGRVTNVAGSTVTLSQQARHRHRDRLAEHEVLREGRDPDRGQRRRSGDRLRPARPRHARRAGRAGRRHLRSGTPPAAAAAAAPDPARSPSQRRPPSRSGQHVGNPEVQPAAPHAPAPSRDRRGLVDPERASPHGPSGGPGTPGQPDPGRGGPGGFGGQGFGHR